MQFGRGMCAILLVLPLFMLVPQPASPFAVGANSGNFQVDPADCSSTVGVDAIRISPTGHRSITSDQTIDFNAILFDAGGGDVEGKVYWSSSSGLIDRETGFFVPAETGSVTVAACAGNEVEMTTVTVRQGATISLEIESEIHSITTDETLDLVLWAVDSKGNRELALIPMMNWEVEGGLQPSWKATYYQFTPRFVGNWSIVAKSADSAATATWWVDVSPGIARSAVLRTDSVEMTTDDSIRLWIELSDAKGNIWPAEGRITAVDSIARTWVSNDGDNWIFSPTRIGSWILEAVYDGSAASNALLDTETITVAAGDLANLAIDGEGEIVTVDQKLSLNPVFTDQHGNEVVPRNVLWIVDGADMSSELNANAWRLAQSSAGAHTVIASAEGRVARISYEVTPGTCADIDTSLDRVLRIEAGMDVPFIVSCTDTHGNKYPVEVNWEGSPNAVEITPDEAGGLGAFQLRGIKVGEHQLTMIADDREETFFVTVLASSLAKLNVVHDTDANQGDQFTFTVHGEDAWGNSVPVNESSLVVETSIGEVSAPNEGEFTVLAEYDGTQQLIVVQSGDITELIYVDIRPNLFEGKFGSSENVLVGVIGGNSFLLLSALLVLLYVSRLAPVRIEDLEAEDEISAAISSNQNNQYSNIAGNEYVGPPSPPVSPPPSLPAAWKAAVDPYAWSAAAPENSPTDLAIASASLLGEKQQSDPYGAAAAASLLVPTTSNIVDTPAAQSVQNQVTSPPLEEKQPPISETKPPAGNVTTNPLPTDPTGAAMRAVPGTVAGKTGWYLGTDGMPKYMAWESGEWKLRS